MNHKDHGYHKDHNDHKRSWVRLKPDTTEMHSDNIGYVRLKPDTTESVRTTSVSG
jgi:hypothetical protein